MNVEPVTLPPSRRANFLAAVIPLAILLGAALGYWLPRPTWRAGAPTPLGDFALVVALGYMVWYGVVRPGRWGRLVPMAGLAIAALILREILWRYSPLGLAVLYGVSTFSAIALTLGSFGLQVLWHLRGGKRWRIGEEPLDVETLAGLVLGGSILIWFLLGAFLSP